jgi:hypothetical protein
MGNKIRLPRHKDTYTQNRLNEKEIEVIVYGGEAAGVIVRDGDEPITIKIQGGGEIQTYNWFSYMYRSGKRVKLRGKSLGQGKAKDAIFRTWQRENG